MLWENVGDSDRFWVQLACVPDSCLVNPDNLSVVLLLSVCVCVRADTVLSLNLCVTSLEQGL